MGYSGDNSSGGVIFNIRPFGTVTVSEFGAIGDGTTDDTVAIRNAITAAGVNGTLAFVTGKTYLITADLQPLSGQTWYGYGAKIKRANETKTTTTDNITTATNPTTINVASAAGFKVGMKVTVTGGRTNSQGCYVAHEITAISGNQLTVVSNFTKAFPSGGTVVTNFGLIKILSGTDRVKIYGLEIDGNRANNDSYLNWQTQDAIVNGGNYAVFKDLYIHDSQADGVMVGGIGTVVDSCTILSSGGNAIHLSGATGVKITNNYCKDATLSITGTDNTTGPDHAEGVITLSSLIVDTIIANNHLENGRTCIGGIGSYDNSDVTITNNTMRGAALYALEINSGEIAAPYLKNIVITSNRFYNSQYVLISNNQSGGTAYESGDRNVVFNSNYLENTRLLIQRGKHINIENNIFDCNTDTTNIIVSLTADSKNILIKGNQVIGGRYGIRHDGTASGIEMIGNDVLVQENMLRNQTDTSIYMTTTSGAAWRNVSIQGNTIRVETGIALAGYHAILAGSGISVLDNRIYQKGGQYGIVCGGDIIATPAGIPGTTVRGNTIRTDTGVPSVRINGGTKGNILHHNYLVQAISNGQADANNTVDTNYTIL